MIAQGEQAFDLAHVGCQVGRCSLHGRFGCALRISSSSGLLARVLSRPLVVRQLSSERPRNFRRNEVFPGVAWRLFAIDQRRHQLPAVKRPGG